MEPSSRQALIGELIGFMAKLERRKDHELARPPVLTGWQLIAALSVMATAAMGTLIITGSAAAVTIVVAPLLLVLRVHIAR
jgi:type IV secretory pathway VirB3-like protein